MRVRVWSVSYLTQAGTPSSIRRTTDVELGFTLARISKLELEHFKAFEKYTISFGDRSYLVGPNSAGKSTIIAAVRSAASMIRAARQTAPSIKRTDRGRSTPSHPFNSERMGLVDENIRYEFRRTDARMKITFSNNAALTAIWPAPTDEDIEADDLPSPFFYLEDEFGRPGLRPKKVREVFPLIGVIPVLTPLDRRESALDAKYVRANVDGRLASRHFRNQLWLESISEARPSTTRGDDERDGWADLIRHFELWAPEIALTDVDLRRDGQFSAEIDVYYSEPPGRTDREISWSGDGMQIWLQLAYHAFRLKAADTVVVDEPDVFLHPDLQRRVVRLLESLPGQTITATHSSEVLGEVSPKSVVWVDKTRSRGVRGDRAPVQLADAIGTQFNLDLAKALRSRKVLFVEGKDLRIIRRLAVKTDAVKLASESGIAVLKLDGFSTWEHVEAFKWLVDSFLKKSVSVDVILDRDYRPDEIVDDIESKMTSFGVHCHIWRKKEIENYLLVPSLLARVAELPRDVTERTLDEITDGMKALVTARMLDEAHKLADRENHRVSISERALSHLEGSWSMLDYRLGTVGGKKVITEFSARSKESGGNSVSAMALAHRIRPLEIDDEMREVITAIEAAL
ncbi:MAG: hypothetical protein CL424_17790 [Acidimicrobiaceae bacterium]|nr:hypothetical protein [Acidimicrobiaceae bacterium]